MPLIPNTLELLHALPFGMMLVALDGTILAANPAVEELFGYPRKGLERQNIDLLVPDRVRGHHHHLRAHWVAAGIDGPMAQARTVEGRRRDGSTLPVQIQLARHAQDDGPGCIVVTVRDQRAVLALETHITRLQGLETAGMATAGMVHDMANLATAMTISLAALQNRGDKVSLALAGAIEQLGALIRRARSAHTPRADQAVRFDLAGLLLRQSPIWSYFGHSALTLDVPETPAPIVGWDSDVLQAVQNLVVNAMQAATQVDPHGGGKVEVRLRQDDDEVRVTVCDTGPGMSTDDYARACEPGFTTRAASGGTGLGLTVVRTIVEAHAGRVRLRRCPELGGLQITLAFPRASSLASTG